MWFICEIFLGYEKNKNEKNEINNFDNFLNCLSKNFSHYLFFSFSLKEEFFRNHEFFLKFFLPKFPM